MLISMENSGSRSSSSPLVKIGGDIIYFITSEVFNNKEIGNIDADYFSVFDQLQIVFNFSTYIIYDIKDNVLKYYDYSGDLIEDLTIKFTKFNRRVKLKKIGNSGSRSSSSPRLGRNLLCLKSFKIDKCFFHKDEWYVLENCDEEASRIICRGFDPPEGHPVRRIIDGNGNTYDFHQYSMFGKYTFVEYFITLKEMRKQKLNKIRENE